MIYLPFDKSVSVKIIDDRLLGEIPFCRVEDKIDMRESEDGNGLTRRECMRDTEEYGRDGISVCVTHRYGNIHICFPKNTPHCKTHPSASVHWFMSLQRKMILDL